MDDSFDEAKIQELIPRMKPRLLFIRERGKIRFVSEPLLKNRILFALRQKEITGSTPVISLVAAGSVEGLEKVKTTLRIFAHKHFYVARNQRDCVGCRTQEPYVS